MRLASRPKQSEQRTVIKFAWLPTEMTNGYVIWLEKYKVQEEYFRGLSRLSSRWETVSIEVDRGMS